MKQQSMVSSFDGTRLFLCKDIPASCKAIVLFVHGLCGHHARYDHLAAACCAQGIGCYRFDHRGHGLSEGERTFYKDWNELTADTNTVIDLAAREHPEIPLFLVGHGMGGLAVLLCGCKYPGKAAGVILSSALSCDSKHLLGAIAPSLNPHIRLPNDLTASLFSLESMAESFENDPHNTKTFTAGLCHALNAGMTWLGSHLPLFAEPVLLLHGDKDTVVLPQDTLDTFRTIASEDKQMKFYGGMYHQIFDEVRREEVIHDILQWITLRLPDDKNL